jgi:nucleoside-diphosphate-sugar epimerase
MGKKVLVIGGTRFFGRHLVRGLLEEGHHVTMATRGLTPDDFGDQLPRLRLDRHDPQTMQEVLGAGDGWDLVYDQMCYSPLDAASASKVFAGRCGRYVMASTIETYGHLYETQADAQAKAFSESALDLAAEPVDLALPWHAPDFPDSYYGAGKRQAEAVLQREAALPFVTVRIAHVLGGRDDFTGRLAHYVHSLAGNTAFHHAAGNGKSSFLTPRAISDFLLWTGAQEFLGPVNAACEGALSALDLHRHAARIVEWKGAEIAEEDPLPRELRSPYDYAQDFRMDTSRASALGYAFPSCVDGLDSLLLDILAAPPTAGWTS